MDHLDYTTIRNATHQDSRELARLIAASASAPRRDLAAWFERGHLLVLDRCDGSLGAAAHIDISGNRGVLDLLVVDRGLADTDAERRLSDVAHAVCSAYGCKQVDTVAEPIA